MPNFQVTWKLPQNGALFGTKPVPFIVNRETSRVDSNQSHIFLGSEFIWEFFLFVLFCVFWSGPFSSNLLCLCFVKQLVMKLIDCLHAYRPKVHEDSAAFYMSGSCQVILKLDEPPFPKAPFNWVVLKLTVTSGQIMAKLQILQTASSNH